MDVALGVAVTDRVARLALVDSAAPGTVIDQFVLDVAEHPVEVLTETVVGTDRSLAGENHRLVATRLCWPDQAKADELQHALQDSGVHDVAVISEAQAATALVGAAHAGSAVLLVGDETATLSVVGDPDAPPTMVAVAPVAGADATSTVDTLMARLGDQALAPGDVFLVGRSAEHTTVLADQLRAASTMRVQTPDDPTSRWPVARRWRPAPLRWRTRPWSRMRPLRSPRPRRGNRVLKASSWRTRRPAITSCFRSTNMRNTTNTGQPRIARRR